MCENEGCTRKAARRGYCRPCIAVLSGRTCTYQGCKLPLVAKGLCSKHWQRKKSGLPLDYDKPVGKTYLSSDGYVVEYIPGHMQADSDGKVLQHRRIYAELLGRRLYSFENIHHRNGIRSDNRLDNLELWVKRQPAGQRVEDLVTYARWIIKEYASE